MEEQIDDIIPCPEYDAKVKLISKTISNLVRLPCGIHILQLVVLDGLKAAKSLTDLLSKSNKLATILHSSGKVSTEYFKHFKTTIPKSTKARWNNVYLQLLAISKLEYGQLENFQRKTKHIECFFTNREMKILKEIVEILEPTYDATLIMEENAFVSLLAPTVFALHDKWCSMLDSICY